MTVSADCACGASITIDDASELAANDLLMKWVTWHAEHRRTLEEYQAYLDKVHRPQPAPSWEVNT